MQELQLAAHARRSRRGWDSDALPSGSGSTGPDDHSEASNTVRPDETSTFFDEDTMGTNGTVRIHGAARGGSGGGGGGEGAGGARRAKMASDFSFASMSVPEHGGGGGADGGSVGLELLHDGDDDLSSAWQSPSVSVSHAAATAAEVSPDRMKKNVAAVMRQHYSLVSRVYDYFSLLFGKVSFEFPVSQSVDVWHVLFVNAHSL